MICVKDRTWSPYIAGALTGLTVVLSVLIAGKFFGASTTYARSAGMLEQLVASEHVAQTAYFVKYVPKIDWQWMLILGVFTGGLISSKIGGTFKTQATPPMWEAKFGSSKAKRAIFAFIGGVILLFGARLAGGCPSGHGLSGMIQMSLSGYIALASFFIGGVSVANIIYRRTRGGM